jgi:hypothetical protein
MAVAHLRRGLLRCPCRIPDCGLLWLARDARRATRQRRRARRNGRNIASVQQTTGELLPGAYIACRPEMPMKRNRTPLCLVPAVPVFDRP